MLHKYIVFYIDWIDHEPISEEINSKSELDAMLNHSKIKPYKSDFDGCKDPESMKSACFDMDCMVHAHRVV